MRATSSRARSRSPVSDSRSVTFSTNDRSTSVHRDAESRHLLRDELVVPAEQASHDALHQTEGRVVRRDRDLGVDPRASSERSSASARFSVTSAGANRAKSASSSRSNAGGYSPAARRGDLRRYFVADLHHVDDVFVVDGVLAHARRSSFSAQQASVRFGLNPESAVS